MQYSAVGLLLLFLLQISQGTPVPPGRADLANPAIITHFDGTYQSKDVCSEQPLETTQIRGSHECSHQSSDSSWSSYAQKCTDIIHNFLKAFGNLVGANDKKSGVLNFNVSTVMKHSPECPKSEEKPSIIIEVTSEDSGSCSGNGGSCGEEVSQPSPQPQPVEPVVLLAEAEEPCDEPEPEDSCDSCDEASQAEPEEPCDDEPETVEVQASASAPVVVMEPSVAPQPAPQLALQPAPQPAPQPILQPAPQPQPVEPVVVLAEAEEPCDEPEPEDSCDSCDEASQAEPEEPCDEEAETLEAQPSFSAPVIVIEPSVAPQPAPQMAPQPSLQPAPQPAPQPVLQAAPQPQPVEPVVVLAEAEEPCDEPEPEDSCDSCDEASQAEPEEPCDDEPETVEVQASASAPVVVMEPSVAPQPAPQVAPQPEPIEPVVLLAEAEEPCDEPEPEDSCDSCDEASKDDSEGSSDESCDESDPIATVTVKSEASVAPEPAPAPAAVEMPAMMAEAPVALEPLSATAPAAMEMPAMMAEAPVALEPLSATAPAAMEMPAMMAEAPAPLTGDLGVPAVGGVLTEVIEPIPYPYTSALSGVSEQPIESIPATQPGEEPNSYCAKASHTCPFSTDGTGTTTAPSYYILISKMPDSNDETYKVEKVFLGDGTPLNCTLNQRTTFPKAMYTPLPLLQQGVVSFQPNKNTSS